MGMMMPFSGMLDALMLVALAMGYVVLYLAKREDKALRTIGYIIGIFIIALSALLILVGLGFKARACGKMAGMSGMMPSRHGMMMQGAPQVPPAQK